MPVLLVVGFGALRTAAALLFAVLSARRGVPLIQLVLQGISDTALAVGTLAFATDRLAERLDGWLVLLMLYAIIWEAYAVAQTVRQRQSHVSGDPVSVATITQEAYWVWEAFSVLPTLLMGIIAADHATGGGAYLFRDDRLDALVAACCGVAVIAWVRRRPALSRSRNQALTTLGVLLLLTAVWVLL